MTMVKSFTHVEPEYQVSVPREASDGDIPKALRGEVQGFVDKVCPLLSGHERTVRLYW